MLAKATLRALKLSQPQSRLLLSANPMVAAQFRTFAKKDKKRSRSGAGVTTDDESETFGQSQSSF